MSDAFGPGALRLAGAAAVLLGWRPGEFWDSTPAEMMAALGGQTDACGEPLDRATLAGLLARFPDEGDGR